MPDPPSEQTGRHCQIQNSHPGNSLPAARFSCNHLPVPIFILQYTVGGGIPHASGGRPVISRNSISLYESTPSFSFCTFGLLVIGCASGPQVDPAVTSPPSRGVDSGTVLKMSNARALDYQDIQNLVAKGVPTNTIVGYLNSTRKTYDLSYAQLAGLSRSKHAAAELPHRDAGVLREHFAEAESADGKTQKDQYYNSPYYQDEQPFADNAPAVDDWYGSGYEESLYSPFSFN